MHRGSPPTVKTKVQKSAEKWMLTVFWDSKGPLLVQYMDPNTTIDGAAYAKTLEELRVAVAEKRGVKKGVGCIFYTTSRHLTRHSTC